MVFVENQTASLHVLRENISRCGSTHHSTIIAQDVMTFLDSSPPRRDPATYDLVFADPPYDTIDFSPLLSHLDSSHRVARQGVVVIEHFKKVLLPLEAGGLRQSRQSRYGDTMLTFYHLASSLDDHSCA